jgi:hypothetical protein
MTKVKPSQSCHLKQIIVELQDDKFSTDGSIFYWKINDISSSEKKLKVQHIGCDKHIREEQIWSKMKSVQILLQKCSFEGENKSPDFFRDLCDALVSTNIPFWALNNKKLQTFLEVSYGCSILD